MATFALKKIEAVVGKQAFYKLEKDGYCELDAFLAQIDADGNYQAEKERLFALMQMVAELKMLPQDKFKDITPAKDTVKEYELKTKNLRLYCFHEEKTGKIVACGGKKNTQNSDINHFRNLKAEYLASKLS